MSTLPDEFRAQLLQLPEWVEATLREALSGMDERTALPRNADNALTVLREPLSDTGVGLASALEQLLSLNEKAGANTQGPRCFHFVIGGNTPAAHAADLAAVAYDTITYAWVTSPVGVRMELQSLEWLKELLGLPSDWPGIMVTGGTMANMVCLATARQWWAESHGVDVSLEGFERLPPMPVLTSGYIHASAKKVLGLLGTGYEQHSDFRPG